MTVKELIALLQKQDPEVDVYYTYEGDNQDVLGVRFDPKADSHLTGWEKFMRPMTAWKDGKEISVEVPERKPIFSYTPGVVIE